MTTTFRTDDLTLAGALLARGHELVETDRHDARHVVFCITPEPETQTLADYAAARLTVNVVRYARAIRELQDAIFGGRRDG